MKNKSRCSWCLSSDLYIEYHDNEWGYPVSDDQRLFEKLSLEGFQAGLSWITILKKREEFRKVFYQFNIKKVAKMNTTHIEKLLQNEGIIRHRGKIEATINNAKQAIILQKEFGSLSHYFWSKAPDKFINEGEIKSLSEASTKISKDLKKRGWKFVGPTTIYSFMQAMGMVNDHDQDCYLYKTITKKQKLFRSNR